MPSPDTGSARPAARQRALAERYQKSGDLARAAAHWRVVALLDPGDERAREALAEIGAASARLATEELALGHAAQRSGDADRAAAAYLRALAADPDNAEAARLLRELERQRASRVQAERAAKAANNAAMAAALPSAPPSKAVDASDAYDIDQRIEMFRAGDTRGGLRELRRFVDAHPGDRAAREQIGTAVYDRARELETQGSREEALELYDQAIALRGERIREWTSRAEALRRTLGAEYYEKGAAAYPRDPALAVQYWEASLRFDPRNAKSAERLAQQRKPGKANGGRNP
jgi:tetratricopeptide (TPR) repeat protein